MGLHPFNSLKKPLPWENVASDTKINQELGNAYGMVSAMDGRHVQKSLAHTSSSSTLVTHCEEAPVLSLDARASLVQMKNEDM